MIKSYSKESEKKVDGKKDMVVYVKLDEYKDIIDIVNLIRTKIKQARYLLDKITELKKQEDTEINTWSSELDSVEEKLGVIDKTLTEPEV